MAYSHSYDVIHKFILVVQSGMDNSWERMLEWMRNVRTDPSFDNEYGILCDFREGAAQLSATEAYACGTVLGKFFQGQKIAYVIPDSFKAIVEQHVLGVQSKAEVRSFSDLQDAENWLSAGPAPP